MTSSLLALILAFEPTCPERPLPALLFPGTLDSFPSNGHVWLEAPLTGELAARITSNGQIVEHRQVVTAQLTRRVVELAPTGLVEGSSLEVELGGRVVAKGRVTAAAGDPMWSGLKWFATAKRKVFPDERCIRGGPFLMLRPLNDAEPVLYRYRLSTASAKKACEAPVTGFGLVSTEGPEDPEVTMGEQRIIRPTLVIGDHWEHEEPGVRFVETPRSRRLFFLCVEALGVTGEPAPPALMQFTLKEVPDRFVCTIPRPIKENELLSPGGTAAKK